MKYRVYCDITAVAHGYIIVNANNREEAAEMVTDECTEDAFKDFAIHAIHEVIPNDVEEED